MALWNLLATMRRHLWLTVLGFSLTIVWAVSASNVTGVFASTTWVTFQMPDWFEENELVVSNASLIDTAGAIAGIVGAEERVRFSSQSVPLSGTGVLDGYSVQQQDSGRQWYRQYDRPEILVQVTGPTSTRVARRTDELVAQIESTLGQMQSDFGVPDQDLIHIDVDERFSSLELETGSSVRAGLMAMVLGSALTVMAVRAFDAVRRRREQLPTG